MKKLYPSIFLAAIVISAIAATVKISDLTLSTSPSTNTFLEIADMNDTPKSKKYLLTNLVTVAQGQASTNALTNTFVLKAGDSMSGALTGPSSTWTNGITAGASTFTGTVGFTGTSTLLNLPSLTTAQKNAATAQAGSQVYDSDLGRVQMYDGAAWHSRVRLDGDTMTGDLTTTGIIITNDAISDIPLQVNALSGTTNNLASIKSGSTNVFRIDASAISTPKFWLGQNDSGPYIQKADEFTVRFGRGTTADFQISNAGIQLRDSGVLGLSSGSIGAASDLFVARDSAATLQFGIDAASPVNQTIKAADGSGTDKTGASFTLEGGQGTGTGTGGSLIFRTGKTGVATGSSANAYDDRARYPAKYITLTDNTVTSLFTVTLPATNSVGISWTCTIMAGNATDFQSLTTVGTIDGVAKTTTITTVGTPTAAQTALAGSAGTLSVTYTFVDLGSNVMALRVTADTDLASLAYLRAKLELTGINIHGAGVVINEL